MTRGEILQMEAGEEIDRLVAEKVMGWHIEKFDTGRDQWRNNDERYQHMVSRYDGYEDDEDFHTICWHPSESMLWVWEVVEKIGGLHLMEMKAFTPPVWRAAFGDFQAEADTASLAICRAALLVVMETV